MPSLQDGIYNLGRLDQLGRLDTAIHRVDARAKVITTLAFLLCVVSFDRYEVISLLPFAVYPIVLASEGRVPYRFLGSRLLIAAPFALAVGIFNPLIDRTAVTLGSATVAAGWISYLSIITRFVLTTAAALTLIATTGLNGVCMALERFGLPDVLSTQLLLLYRYIFVLTEETLRMARARALRSFRGRGLGWRVYSRILGQLLMRTYDRASRIYGAMLVRGFNGKVRTSRQTGWTNRDTVFVIGWSAAFALFRLVNVPLALGRIITELI